MAKHFANIIAFKAPADAGRALTAVERDRARLAIEAGRQADIRHFDQLCGEWFVRRAGLREFRGMMACRYRELPFDSQSGRKAWWFRVGVGGSSNDRLSLFKTRFS